MDEGIKREIKYKIIINPEICFVITGIPLKEFTYLLLFCFKKWVKNFERFLKILV